jgi:hypothetical protein
MQDFIFRRARDQIDQAVAALTTLKTLLARMEGMQEQSGGVSLTPRLARRRDNTPRGRVRMFAQNATGRFTAADVVRAHPDLDHAKVSGHLAVLANLGEVLRLERGTYRRAAQ